MIDIFDEPAVWRGEAVSALGLTGDDLIAGLSPGAGFPAALRSIRNALPDDIGVLVDMGAGVGAVSEWFRQETGATVVAVEPASGARAVAREFFPELDVRNGSMSSASMSPGSADVVTMCGVLSLVDDATGAIACALQLLRPGGAVAIADLFSMDERQLIAPPNVFRSPELVIEMLEAAGFEIVEVGCGEPASHPSWSTSGVEVDEWIRLHCRGEPGFQSWEEDQRHLRSLIEAGELGSVCVIARLK